MKNNTCTMFNVVGTISSRTTFDRFYSNFCSISRLLEYSPRKDPLPVSFFINKNVPIF